MGHIFISYSHKDSSYVHKLAEALEQEGFEVWIDDRIHYGSEWPKVVTRNLDVSDGVIVVLSNNSYKSDMVQNEVTRAREKKKPIFPLLFDGDNWLIVQAKQFVDVKDGSLPPEKFYKRLEEITPRKNAKADRKAAEKVAREKAEQVAVEKARLEAEELARQKAIKEKADRIAAEKVAREKTEKENAKELARQKDLKEKADREAAEKARLDAEEKAKQKVANEKSRLERIKREGTKPKPAQKSEIQAPKSNLGTKTFLGVVGVTGLFGFVGIAVVILVIWLSSLNGTPSTPVPTSTRTPLPQVSSSSTTIKTAIPSSVPSTKLVSTSTQLPANTALPLQTKITDAKGVSMVLVPEGEFTMGSDKYIVLDASAESSQPSHILSLPSYYIDKFEVTNLLYSVCVNEGICLQPTDNTFYIDSTRKDHPVVYVNWYMAQNYCEWRDARLPTEAEWEKAARGLDGRTFPWGENFSCENGNSLYGREPCIGDTTAVGTYMNGTSPYGLFDMSGNVWEWTSSLALAYPYDFTDGRESVNESGFRILRGGSRNNYSDHATTTIRYGKNPFDARSLYGFRCAEDAAP